jgi:hypothetical protein
MSSAVSFDLNAAVAAATAAAAAAAGALVTTQAPGDPSKTSGGPASQPSTDTASQDLQQVAAPSRTEELLLGTSGTTSSFSNPLWEESGAEKNYGGAAAAGPGAVVVASSEDVGTRLAETHDRGAASTELASQRKHYEGSEDAVDAGYNQTSLYQAVAAAAAPSSRSGGLEMGQVEWRTAAGAAADDRTRRTSSGSLKKSYSGRFGSYLCCGIS